MTGIKGVIWQRPDKSLVLLETQLELLDAMDSVIEQMRVAVEDNDRFAAHGYGVRFEELFGAWRDLEIERLQGEAREVSERLKPFELRPGWWKELSHYAEMEGKPVSALQLQILKGSAFVPKDWQEAAATIDRDPTYALSSTSASQQVESVERFLAAGTKLTSLIEGCVALLAHATPRSENYRIYRDHDRDEYVAAVQQFDRLWDEINA